MCSCFCCVQVSEVIQQQAVCEAVPATHTAEEDARRGIIEKAHGEPWEGVGAREQQTDYVVTQECSSSNT